MNLPSSFHALIFDEILITLSLTPCVIPVVECKVLNLPELPNSHLRKFYIITRSSFSDHQSYPELAVFQLIKPCSQESYSWSRKTGLTAFTVSAEIPSIYASWPLSHCIVLTVKTVLCSPLESSVHRNTSLVKCSMNIHEMSKWMKVGVKEQSKRGI